MFRQPEALRRNSVTQQFRNSGNHIDLVRVQPPAYVHTSSFVHLDPDLLSALTAAILHKIDECEHLRAPPPPPPPPPVVKEESVEYEYERHPCGGKGQTELVRVPKRKADEALGP